jgi:hypothetical protein
VQVIIALIVKPEGFPLDFVPAGHLSRFVVALVTEELDLSAIMASYKGEKGPRRNRYALARIRRRTG